MYTRLQQLFFFLNYAAFQSNNESAIYYVMWSHLKVKVVIMQCVNAAI